MNTKPLRVAGCFLAVAILPVVALPGVAQTAPARHGLDQAPAGLVAAITRTEAQEAAANPAYAIGKNGCASLPAGSKGSTLAGCFGRHGPAFRAGKEQLNLQLTAWGRAGRLQPVTLTRSAPQANRIEYRGPHIAEWWRVLPLGYEQGFTLNAAPAGTGQVVLQLSASRAPTLEHGTPAWGTLRYGKLHVVDANGKVLPATLSAQGKTITLAFDAAHARYPISIDPLVWVQQEVIASDGVANAFFGYSVALSGDGTTALVGASGTSTAYVYTLANGAWSQAAELTASNSVAYDEFGSSVALSSAGTTALVGAAGTDVSPAGDNIPGAVYVYTMPSGGWATTSAYTAELTASGGVAYDHFGYSVAISSAGTTALVGVYNKTVGGDTLQGAAYVYTMPNGGWASTSAYAAELTASDGATNDYFGDSVALSSNGTTALVGAYFKTVGGNSGQGVAYVYTMPNGGWASTSAYTAELTAGDGAAGNRFGYSVALSSAGTTALVGATRKAVASSTEQGAAYVYTMPNGGWVSTSAYTAELTASDGATNDRFGDSVALSSAGTTALVGAYQKTVGSNSGRGATYVYTMPNGGWASTSAYTAELTASDGATNDRFGDSVALSANGTTVLVGADTTSVGSSSMQGAAYFFTGSDLSAVLNGLATVQMGAQFPSQYILSNASMTASAPLTVMLPLPATGASYVSASASQGTCSYDSTAKVATCAVGRIVGNGGTATSTLTLKATGAAGSAIAQSANLTNGSPNLAQTASTTIVPPPPTLSGLSNVTVTAPNAGSEAFTLAGTGTLTVTATSANTTLLPNANITGASSCIQAGSCALTLTPASGQSGTATVTVTVTDTYNQSGSGTFQVTVKAAPPPPAPPSGGGGGSLGWLALAMLGLLGVFARKRD